MYAQQLNRLRLDKKGLTMQVCLKNSKQQANSVLAAKDGKYTIYEVHKFIKKELVFFLNNNKKIKRLVSPNCGASLSLKNGCKCLYCDSELDLINIDWVIDKYDIL